MNEPMAEQIPQEARALSMLNDIDIGIEIGITGRLEQVVKKISTILKPVSSDANIEPGNKPPSVNSELITRLENTHRKIDIVGNALDQLIARIDV
jgi:hypothetical protein